MPIGGAVPPCPSAMQGGGSSTVVGIPARVKEGARVDLRFESPTRGRCLRRATDGRTKSCTVLEVGSAGMKLALDTASFSSTPSWPGPGTAVRGKRLVVGSSPLIFGFPSSHLHMCVQLRWVVCVLVFAACFAYVRCACLYFGVSAIWITKAITFLIDYLKFA